MKDKNLKLLTTVWLVVTVVIWKRCENVLKLSTELSGYVVLRNYHTDLN